MFIIKSRYYKQADKGYTFKVLKTTEEVEAHRQEWQEMEIHPNSAIDYYLTVVKSFKQVIRPHVILLYKDKQLRNIIIGRVEREPFPINFGYKTLWAPKMRLLKIIYCGILGDITDESAAALILALKRSIGSREADIISFANNKPDSPLFKALKAMPLGLCRSHFPTLSLHWVLILPETYNEYVNSLSKSSRKNILNKTNRLYKAHNILLQKYEKPGDMETLMQDMEKIAGQTYHRGLNVGFINDEATRRRIRLLLEQGRYCSYIMYADGIPVAFNDGIRFNTTLFLETTGYDPAFHQYSIGNILRLKMFEDLVDRHSIKVIDFGFGDADYKQSFCNSRWPEAAVMLFAPTLKAAGINFLVNVFAILNQAAVKFLKQTNLLALIKKMWRNRIAHNE